MIEGLLKQFQLPESCQVVLPKDGDVLHDIISRWSDLGVSAPAAIIKPSTVDDIVAVVKFASKNGFRVLPQNGAHSTFVRIDDRTLYLDMKKLGTVSIDKANSCVSLGGGTTTGDMLRACASEGYYTCVTFHALFCEIFTLLTCN
jgi:FAD/FMN-containing dehydrogenase